MKEMLLDCRCHKDGSEKSVTKKARLDKGGDEGIDVFIHVFCCCRKNHGF